MANDPFHCDECGCALHDAEMFGGQNVCDPCRQDEQDGDPEDDPYLNEPVYGEGQ